MISRKTLTTLEYDKVLDFLARFACSGSAKKIIARMRPLSTLSEIISELALTEQAERARFEFLVSPSFDFADVSEEVKGATVGKCVSMGDLIRISALMKTARAAHSAVTDINETDLEQLADIAHGLYCDAVLEREIDKSIESETQMSDNASERLKEIREATLALYAKSKRVLTTYITGKSQKYLQDNIITMRNGRYVLAVRSEHRMHIKGLVHDESQSGATLYVEPYEIVEINNQIAGKKIEENNEIQRILAEFTVKIAAMADCIINNIDVLTRLDVIFARAAYANNAKCVKPEINSSGRINIKKARHPLIAADKVVPISLNLGNAFSVLLITGPNTGGKTVTMKLTGLFTAMAMSGMHVPAEYAELSVFENIFCDIGDEQSIENSLSTFSSHMMRLINITENVNGKSLVLLDELGAGTDPAEGAALAVAVTKFIEKSGARAILTSHYNEMKEYGYSENAACNACMAFNPKTFAPTYELVIGVSGSSNAIEIAKRLGLNKSIIENAASLLSEEKVQFDAIIRRAEEIRKKAEDESKRIEVMKAETAKKLADISKDREYLRVKREKIEEQSVKESTRLVAEYTEEAEEAIEKIKEILKNPTEQGLFTARKLKSKLANIRYNKSEQKDLTEYDNSEVAVGDSVFVKSINGVGTVTEINLSRKEYKVRIGMITSNVKIADCAKIKAGPKRAEKTVRVSQPLVTQAYPTELNVIGKRAYEAVPEAEKYLDGAMTAGLAEARIVHGKGTGRLRAVLHEFLRDNGYVFRLGKYGEGEDGVTVVALKKDV